MKNIIVIGSSGAIGQAFAEYFAGQADTATVHALSRSGAAFDHAKVTPLTIDITQEASVAAAATVLGKVPVHTIILATGILHDDNSLRPEKSLGDIDADTLQRVLAINTVGPALLMKHFLPLLTRDKRAVFAALSARVGSIGDNRLGGWYAYRASKAALNMLIKTAALEMKRRNRTAIVVGLHPGTVDSGLSRPFQARVPEGKLFAPQTAVAHMAAVLDNLAVTDSGKCLAWDGQEIPP